MVKLASLLTSNGNIQLVIEYIAMCMDVASDTNGLAQRFSRLHVSTAR